MCTKYRKKERKTKPIIWTFSCYSLLQCHMILQAIIVICWFEKHFFSFSMLKTVVQFNNLWKSLYILFQDYFMNIKFKRKAFIWNRNLLWHINVFTFTFVHVPLLHQINQKFKTSIRPVSLLRPREHHVISAMFHHLRQILGISENHNRIMISNTNCSPPAVPHAPRTYGSTANMETWPNISQKLTVRDSLLNTAPHLPNTEHISDTWKSC